MKVSSPSSRMPFVMVQPVDNTTANATATVLNVKSVTQLPLTGAAGTVLFTSWRCWWVALAWLWRSRVVAARTERMRSV